MDKFNLAWQLTRVKARDIKDVPAKVEFVINFLNKHPNVHNYARVYNWLRMTKLGYDSRREFDSAIAYLETHRADYAKSTDYEVDIEDVATEDLEKLVKDLSKRKYDFQFGSTPKAHIEFVERLTKKLEKREDVEGGSGEDVS